MICRGFSDAISAGPPTGPVARAALRSVGARTHGALVRYLGLMSLRVQLVLAAVIVAVVTLVTFAPASGGTVLNWDDAVYLTAARDTPLPVLLTSIQVTNYHPLTMLSYALELRIAPYGLAFFHATNIVIHVATSVLVLLLLWQLVDSIPAAALGALLWSVHPLRAESVAWLAERKDDLYAFFFVAALIAYVSYVRGKRAAMVWTFLLFLLAVLSKVSAITFPLAMLMIDFLENRRLDRRLFAEKVPFFGASVIFGLIGMAGQRALSHLMPGFSNSTGMNLLLSFRTITMYIERTIVPVNLSALYPYPRSLGPAEWVAPLLVFALLALAVATLRWSRAPAFALGFFLMSISITLPFFAKAWAVAADRYTYVASIGFSYLAAEAIRRWRAALVIAVPAVLGLALLTCGRIAVWHDSVTLWSSVLQYDDSIALAYDNRGAALAGAGLNPQGRADFDRAIAIDPCFARALRNRATLNLKEGHRLEASRDLARADECDRIASQTKQ
jgi:hypothetical protein